MKSNLKQNRGFFQIVALIIVVLVIAFFFNLGPDEIWSKYLFPVIQFIWNIVVWVATFLFGILKWAWASLMQIINK